jgi:hypothetical protein
MRSAPPARRTRPHRPPWSQRHHRRTYCRRRITSPSRPRYQFNPPRWFTWGTLWEENQALLKHLGVYVIAWSDGPPSPVPRGTEEQVVYIGETHGRTASLANRLGQFGNSAGIIAPPKDGHYAALSFRLRLGLDAAPGAALSAEDRARIFVALCPAPAELHGESRQRDLRGILPGLWESQLLWDFTRERGHLPLLNSAGSHGGADRHAWARRSADALEPGDIEGLLSGGDESRFAACTRIVRHAPSRGLDSERPRVRLTVGQKWMSVRGCG